MSEANGKVCCSCGHNIRTGEVPDIKCHCDVDGHNIGYLECMSGWCRHWKRDRRWEEGSREERTVRGNHYEAVYGDYEITYVWGFDVDEKNRADRIVESNPQFNHEFPLIEKNLTKEEVHGLFERTFDFARPFMYELGYSNNNCVGCIRGGMGYWNRIRKDFPEVFESRAKLERKVGHSILKDKNGSVYLDELDPERGNMNTEIMPECGIMCYLAQY